MARGARTTRDESDEAPHRPLNTSGGFNTKTIVRSASGCFPSPTFTFTVDACVLQLLSPRELTVFRPINQHSGDPVAYQDQRGVQYPIQTMTDHQQSNISNHATFQRATVHPDTNSYAAQHQSQEVSGNSGDNTSPDDIAGEDAYMQTLQQLGSGQGPTTLSPHPTQDRASRRPQFIEYSNKLSSISVLAEALGHRQQRRLIQLDLPGTSGSPCDTNKQMSGLEQAEVTYLNAKRVFDLPPSNAW